MYKLCFLPLLLVFVMKCVKMHCSLPHNPYKLLLASFTCVLASPAVHVSTLHPLLAHHHLCVMLMSIMFFFYFIFAVFLGFFYVHRLCFFLAFVTFDVCVVFFCCVPLFAIGLAPILGLFFKQYVLCQ